MRFKYTVHKSFTIEVDSDKMLEAYPEEFEWREFDTEEEDEVQEFVEEMLEEKGVKTAGIVSCVDDDEWEVEVWTGRRVD